MKKIIFILMVIALISCDSKKSEESKVRLKAISESIKQVTEDTERLVSENDYCNGLGAINSKINSYK